MWVVPRDLRRQQARGTAALVFPWQMLVPHISPPLRRQQWRACLMTWTAARQHQPEEWGVALTAKEGIGGLVECVRWYVWYDDRTSTKARYNGIL